MTGGHQVEEVGRRLRIAKEEIAARAFRKYPWPEWDRGDLGLAAHVWQRFTAAAKAELRPLLARPMLVWSAAELMVAAGVRTGRHGVAGVLSKPAEHCKDVNRAWCWYFPTHAGVQYYFMTPVQAELFRRADELVGS